MISISEYFELIVTPVSLDTRGAIGYNLLFGGVDKEGLERASPLAPCEMGFAP